MAVCLGHPQQAVHVAGKIDNDPIPERFAGQSGSRAAGAERNLMLCRIADTGNDIGEVSGANDCLRTNLIDAGVRRIELQKQIIAEDVAGKQSAQIFLNAYLFLIHLQARWFS